MKIIYYDETYLQDCASIFMDHYNSEEYGCSFNRLKATTYLQEIIYKPRFVGLLMMKKNKVIGFAFCHLRTWDEKDDLHIDELLVKEEQPEEEVKAKLLNFIESYTKNYELAGITTTTNSLAVTDFYLKNDFLDHDVTFLYKGIAKPS